MHIANFECVRLGSEFPHSLDVCRIGGHESYGVFAVAYTYMMDSEKGYVQVRKHSKVNEIALFAFRWPQELPEHWKDSTVLWDSRSAP